MNEINFEYQFRLILVGPTTVGKSSLLRSFTEGKFLENCEPTVGVDFYARIVNVDGSCIKLQLWDTAGQERFRAITRSYYRNAAGGLLVYDVTNRRSFEEVKDWLDEAKRCAEPNKIVFVLVGHKTDRTKERRVTTQEGQALAERLNLPFIETSAKATSNVEEAFYMVTREISRQLQSGEVRVKEGWDGVKKATARRIATVPVASPDMTSAPAKEGGCCK
eukprot:m.309356 g.309356  ORF g.309356 m.309356 type:complete len:220 (+) comp46152_c0_seq1:73-732(+)